MRYSLLVAWREYAENAKTKGFWIGIMLTPLLLLLSFQIPVLLREKAEPIRYFVLVDQSGSLGSAIEARMDRTYEQKLLRALQDYARKYSVHSNAAPAEKSWNDWSEASPEAVAAFQAEGGMDSFLKQLQPNLKPGAPAFEPPRRLLQQVPLPSGLPSDGDLASIANQLRPYLRGAQELSFKGEQIHLNAAILIPKDLQALIVRPAGSSVQADPSKSRQIQFWSANAADSEIKDEVEAAVNDEIRRREYLARGMDGQAIRQVEQTYAAFASLNPKKEAGKEAMSVEDSIRQWLPSGFVYMLWIAIFIIVQMLLNNTIEEKSNRIIEVLLSSVTPGELMMGKLMGIAAIGLTMIGAWILALIAILTWKAGGASEFAGPVLAVLKGSSLVPFFALYFLLGYLMYAAFILSIGSVCNTIKEAQSYMSVMTILLIVPMLTMTFIPRDPNGPLARLLSWIPIYTPFIMLNRAAADPPLFDVVGTLILLLATAVTALYMSGKVFRIGVLRTGQPPKVVEMLRWATGNSERDRRKNPGAAV